MASDRGDRPVAVLLTDAPGPVVPFGDPGRVEGAALVPDTPAPSSDDADLRARLDRLGWRVAGPVPVTRAGELIEATGADGPIALLHDGLVAHEHALRMLLADTRADLAVLPDTVTGELTAVRCSRRCARSLPDLLPVPGEDVRSVDDLADHLVTGVAGQPGDWSVRRTEVGVLVAAVASDPAGTLGIQAGLAATDAAGGEEAARLEQSVKRLDNPIAAHLVAPWSKRLARALVRIRVPPDAVTATSLVLALLGAAAACTGTRLGYGLGLIGMLASFALDCTDGQMARYAVRYSALGAWLDAFGDRVKEQLFVAGLAIGATRATLSGAGSVMGAGVGAADRGAVDDRLLLLWLLATLAAGVTLVRQTVAFGWVHANGLPLAPPVPSGQLSVAQRARFDLRKLAMLPFGERTLLFGLVAVVVSPFWAFVVVAACGILATLAMAAGRVRRSGGSRVRLRTERRELLARLADVGPLGSALRRMLTPVAFRSVPVGVVVAVVPPLVALAAAGLLLVRAWGSAEHRGSVAVLLVAAAIWWLGTATMQAARPDGPLGWLQPALTATVELAAILTGAAALASVVAGARNPGRGPVQAGIAGFVLAGVVTLHRYRREYAAGLTGERTVGSVGRGLALRRSAALGQEGRIVLVAVLGAWALWTRSSAAEIGWWVLVGLVAVVLVAAAAGDLRAALALQRSRR